MAKKETIVGYALVRHSGYGYGNDPQFAYGLETRSVTAKQAEKIRDIGGVVFDLYGDAEDAAQLLMYPQGYEGMTPVADRSGDFASHMVDGLAVYRPRLDLVLAAK